MFLWKEDDDIEKHIPAVLDVNALGTLAINAPPDLWLWKLKHFFPGNCSGYSVIFNRIPG